MIITIDGPVASGKSTVSRMIAEKLGYYYLCTGLLYRALAYLLVHQRGYTLETIANPRMEDIAHCLDAQRFKYQYIKSPSCARPELVEGYPRALKDTLQQVQGERGKTKISSDEFDEHAQEHILFNNQDITPYLKDSFMDKVTSIVSVNEQVRSAVTTIQRTITLHHNVVTDGRDVGSVVFPHAVFKFFVTASVLVRAERWRKDQEKYGNYLPTDHAMALITDRDNRDKNRAIAPLVIPTDAIVIDTSALTIQQTVDTMMRFIDGCAPVDGV